jgi:PAS domain S-box-containing protein
MSLIRAEAERSVGGRPGELPIESSGVSVLSELSWSQTENSEARRLRLIADALPAYIAYVDDEMRYVMVNRTYEEWFGRSADQIVGQPVAEVLGTSFENVRPHLERALAGSTEHFETRMATVDGERFLQVMQLPDYDPEGRVRGVIIHGHDVTARRNAEEALRVSEERLRMTLSAANGVGTWDWNVAQDQVRADERFAALFEVDRELARTGAAIEVFFKSVHVEDVDRVKAAIGAAIETGEEYACEYRLALADGGTRWVSAHGRCLYSLTGEPTRFPGIVLDVTERKRQEAALMQSEKLVAVGRLASSIAHEINNPLESVVNLLYLVEQMAVDETMKRYVQTAQEELARVAQITTQTLRFFKQSTAPAQTRPAELVDSVLALYRGRLARARVTVERRVRSEGRGLLLDGELRQVLNNLVSNALDAMRDGGVLRIGAVDWTDSRTGRAGLRMTVADTGSGIAKKDLGKIFEPFYTTKGLTGTGLGLWVSEQLIKKNEGHIAVRSSRGGKHRGTIFSLFVPYMPEVKPVCVVG